MTGSTTGSTDHQLTTPRQRALLDCAVAAIEANGEAGLRVEEVARCAGLAVSAIYHRFGSRQELVDAAQQQRFKDAWGTSVSSDIERLQGLAERARDMEHLRELLASFGSDVGGEHRAENRMQRLMIIGNAIHQPGLRGVIADAYQQYLDASRAAVATAMSRGIMRRDLDPGLGAAWLHVHLFGRVVDEVHPAPTIPERTNALRHQALRWFFFDDFNQTGYGAVLPPTRPVIPETKAANGIDDDTDDLHATGRRILARVIEQIDQGGEASVRLRQIAQAEHLSETVIHRHFGGRENLLMAAHAERFRTAVAHDADHFVRMTMACRNAEEFRTVLSIALRIRLGAAAEPQRLRRLNAIGACHGRPELAERIGGILHAEAAGWAVGFEHARDHGWIAADVDTLAICHWMTSVEVSQVLFEIDDLALDLDAWRSMVIAFCMRALGQ